MHLRHTKALRLQDRRAYGACGYIVTDSSDSGMQRGDMKGVALTQKQGLMQKVASFALELIMNFKFRLSCHSCLPVGRKGYAI
ncbi:hypothetical protein PSCICM_09960 [Pseudomonas cichorii]|uniref:Uncharacterized protein n=1 Tax=Pseudomonas cichorii TaxID=36746 RepID=A0A3M4VQ44_PSECI|nr:hypothetical protein PCH70_29340 [Pseudomonas cichorii JBC1]RMR53763.1 hypothetical protein ALP84_02147 [Pseudomonas cichorii]GFM75177.1 hypothetical protein PSCICM_09960 [Pseudomonas cichorii]GFM93009.1 hypothetical protein PSCICP_29810 [Pseudomonas cichorii]SDO25533.1 hypothetical protein SAMN05216599_10716 [Pseudomonas cichorii]